PSDSQVRPPSAVPSHSSAPLIAPLPQNEQGVVSKWHCWQARAPLAKPSDAQLAPPSASPSHSSPCEMAPSPQSVGRIAPTPELFCGVGCSSPAQPAAVTPLAPTLCSERCSGRTLRQVVREREHALARRRAGRVVEHEVGGAPDPAAVRERLLAGGEQAELDELERRVPLKAREHLVKRDQVVVGRRRAGDNERDEESDG